jgi:hypothetical protein
LLTKNKNETRFGAVEEHHHDGIEVVPAREVAAAGGVEGREHGGGVVEPLDIGEVAYSS